MAKIFSFLYLRWLLFFPIAFSAGFFIGEFWEKIFDLVVYVFWPNFSRTIGPEDLEFFYSATESNTYNIIRFLTRTMLSTAIYFHSGLLFFKKDERSNPINILAGIYILMYFAFLVFLINNSLNFQLKIIITAVLLFIIFYYRILRSTYCYENKSKVEIIWDRILEIKWVSTFVYRTKKISYYLFEKTFGIIAAVYVIVAHIYFFVVLYSYWQENGFNNLLTTGVLYSLWKAVFWMFYIW